MSGSPRRSKQHKPCKSIAVLGTMSDAGKSIITAGICRVFSNHGVRVAPFKGQNMSNNAAPALIPERDRREPLYKAFEQVISKKKAGSKSKKGEGSSSSSLNASKSEEQGYGEIGTAQALQAEACRLVPRVEMNPLLLKSGGKNEKGEYMCSVVVLGKQIVRETYGDLGKRTGPMKEMILQSHRALAQATDASVIVLEGAGSCTELNLASRDVVNLSLVRALKCRWILVANIDCGGVFAQIVGTKACLSKEDWDACAGVIVNKLRGEAKYFEPGPSILEKMVSKPIFVVPYLYNLNLPEEDGLGIERRLAWETSGTVPNPTGPDANKDYKKPTVVVVAYPHIAIADDLCPLENDPRFEVQWRRRRIPARPYPDVTAIILPGSRLTQLDLKWLHDSGWAKFIQKHAAAGGVVLGICGGYQMLGWSVDDPHNVESSHSSDNKDVAKNTSRPGVGLLPIETTLKPAECKIVRPLKGKLLPSNLPVNGFELHCGISKIVLGSIPTKPKDTAPLMEFENGRPEGMVHGLNQNVKGTYMHGILRQAKAREELLVPRKEDYQNLFGINESSTESIKVEDPLDRLAKHLESCGLTYDTLQSMLQPQEEKSRKSTPVEV
ncbi:unnamed protein product [Cylindrotheca closterium]|uniref:Cobyric acid synthase n=1 Tax=Cylindrotheca closterium TaxID=2856 RepID=A0AAD2JKA7_9STRA|nr:unnamed protein product [Cylindrotheca closterium]